MKKKKNWQKRTAEQIEVNECDENSGKTHGYTTDGYMRVWLLENTESVRPLRDGGKLPVLNSELTNNHPSLVRGHTKVDGNREDRSCWELYSSTITAPIVHSVDSLDVFFDNPAVSPDSCYV